MKGLIFNEFLDFVERRSGYETTDRMIALSKLPSGGAYTAAGNYPYTEMSALMTAYCEISEQKLPELLQVFGEYLFQRFAEIYPALFENCDDPFDFFEVLEERFHAQILKFYQNQAHFRRCAANQLQILQTSRPSVHRPYPRLRRLF
jgi:hypothetical protein